MKVGLYLSIRIHTCIAQKSHLVVVLGATTNSSKSFLVWAMSMDAMNYTGMSCHVKVDEIDEIDETEWT